MFSTTAEVYEYIYNNSKLNVCAKKIKVERPERKKAEQGYYKEKEREGERAR